MPPLVDRCDRDELLRLMRAGDLVALDRMTRCYGERLIATGRRHCRGEEEARDAVQDALLAAGEHLQDYRAEGSVEGWLVRMVIRACGRQRRGRKNDPLLHVREASLTSAAASPEQLAARGELAIALGEALGALSPTDRLIVLLAEGEDWTGPEISAELGLTPGAVRSRLSRARRRLRERLEKLHAS